jgi:hypothetical protein
MIPDHKLDILINTCDLAARMAGRGELVDGHGELVYGRARAEVLREEGHEWAGTLVTRYGIAVENYCQRWGPWW